MRNKHKNKAGNKMEKEKELEKEIKEEKEKEKESAAATEASAEDEAGGGDKEPEKPDARSDKKDEKIKELEDKVLRQMAEFENFRKRSEKEKSQMYDMGAKSVIEKMLPVIDNFERGLATLTQEQKKDPFAEGIDKVYTQLMTELSGIGVTPIAAEGEPFDPELHNAVSQIESDELASGTVAQELLKGYKYHDSVVRHSMVSVVS